MQLRPSTQSFDDTSLYTPILKLPYMQGANFKITFYTLTDTVMAVGTYLIANTGVGFNVKLLSGDDIFDPKVIRSYEEKWTVLAVTNAFKAPVGAVLEYSNHDSYFKPLFYQPFKKIEDFGGKDLTIKKKYYQQHPSFEFGAKWSDNKQNGVKATNVFQHGNQVTVTLNAVRSDANVGWDDLILSNLPKPHLDSAGYYNNFFVKNDGKWLTVATILNNDGKLLIEDSTFAYQVGLKTEKNLNIYGTFSYPTFN